MNTNQNSESFNQPKYSSIEIQCQISNDVLSNTKHIENKDQKPKMSEEDINIDQNKKGNILSEDKKNIICRIIEEEEEEEEEYESDFSENDSDEPEEDTNEEYTPDDDNKNDGTNSSGNNEEEYYSDYYSGDNNDSIIKYKSENSSLNKKYRKNTNYHHKPRKFVNRAASNPNKHSYHKKKHRHCTSDQRVNPKTEEGRKAIAHQTLKIIKNGKYTFRRKDNIIEEINISKQISNCVEHTKTYRPNYYYTKKPRNPTAHKKKKLCQIEIDSESTFGVAKRLVKKEKITKTCVLNFASATKPGGGFKNGRTAQEESLARQSALYQSLKTHPEMYKYNLKNSNNDSFYNDYMIYSSRVPVFRSDVSERLFSKNEVFETSVITSAAPNLHDVSKYQQERKHYKTIFYERCRKILLLAIEKHNDAIVLGAYGCGVFENDPRFVSSVFKKLLVKGKNGDEPLGNYFTKVVFSIISSKSENYQVFSKRFKDYINPKKK